MSTKTKKTTRSIRFTLIKAFIFICLLMTTVTVALQYYVSQSTAQKSALALYETEALVISNKIKQADQIANHYSILLSKFNKLLVNQKLHPDALQLFANVMAENPSYNSISLGFENGDLQQLIHLNKAKNDQSLANVESAKWLLISISEQGSQKIRQYAYFDDAFNVISQRQEENNENITGLSWYKDAKVLTSNKSNVFSLTNSNSLTQTYSIKVPNTQIVLAIDATLSSFSNSLQKINGNKQNPLLDEIYLYNGTGQVLGSNQPRERTTNTNKLPLVPYPVLIEMAQHQTSLNKLNNVTINDKPYYAYIAEVDDKTATNSYLAILVAKETLLLPSIKTSIQISALSLALLLILSWCFSSPLTNTIKGLLNEIKRAKGQDYKKLQQVVSRVTELKELNISMIEMSQSIEDYQAQQKQMTERFIKQIAQAIDDKSPYTFGHANRAPELGMMLAKASLKSDLPAFEQVDEEMLSEFSSNAWSHHYGKLTTAQQVTSKSTKLEANYNRIHEIRMRFEILWRDAEISYFKQSRGNPEQNKPLKETLIKQQLQLMRDFGFVAKANLGDTTMSEQETLRLHRIGAQTWLRYFDDRLGLSSIEKLRLTDKKQKLPVQETLLSDKKEHIIKRNNITKIDSGIKIEVADHLYNFGELYNLSIPKGTLTVEDKFEINQSILSTINLLKALPTSHKQVIKVQDLSAYHPVLKYVSCPSKANNVGFSITSRILLMTDIFETLTSVKTPQQKVESLSTAIEILHQLAVDQVIDMNLFKLFLSSGIYIKYANKFLHETQFDDVDISKYLN
ncbi:HD domain-containing phosphohydrolase [Psychromonas sp. SP041]|uniref:HD domain-containing phosphohydrolase n=1 Tax=Psychromonas sp. SP041 TaxID=1365007 RepID=UPI000417B935|nr:HD domain-containing phosphohydrolase [Psychromonas sp. SP041]